VEYLIGALLVLLSLSPVIFPFFRPPEEGPTQSESEELQGLLAEKQVLYAAIMELDFDHRAGKLALEDYQEARRSYELRAVAVLERIDRLAGGPEGKDVTSEQERSR